MPSHTAIYTTFSVVGFLLLWGIMGANGGSAAMLDTALNGVFPDGSTLANPRRIGVFPMDVQLNILIAFFASLSKLAEDAAPYTMLLDLTTSLLAINMTVLVESRRRTGFWLRSPALWQYAWNCGGVAVFLPIWCLLYVRQRDVAGPVAIAAGDAWALPLTAVLSVFLEAPLLAPAILGRDWAHVQRGVALFFCGPPVFSAFQTLVSRLVSGPPTTANGSAAGAVRENRSGVLRAYCITGMITGLVHLGSVLFALFSSQPGMSLGRVYFPHNGLVRAGEANVLTEAAFLFLQYDYVIINTTVLALGTHLLRTKPGSAAKGKEWSPGSLGVFYAITTLFGPGASMAYAMACEEVASGAGGVGIGAKVKAFGG